MDKAEIIATADIESAISCALIAESVGQSGFDVLVRMLQIESRDRVLELLEAGKFGSGIRIALARSIAEFKTE